MSGTISGKVVEVSSEGDLITDIQGDNLSDAPRDSTLRIVVDEHETFGLHPVEHSQPAMTLVAILPSEGPIKIALVGDSASAMLGVQVGAPVEVSW